MDKEELLNGLKLKFGNTRLGFVDNLRAHLTDEALLTKPPQLELDMPEVQILITLKPGFGGYAMTVAAKPEDGVQADTIIDGCLRAARYFESLQRMHELKSVLREVLNEPHA